MCRRNSFTLRRCCGKNKITNKTVCIRVCLYLCVCAVHRMCVVISFLVGHVCSVTFHTGYNTDVYTQQIEMRNGSQLWPKRLAERIWVVRQSIVTSLLCSLPANCFLLLSNPPPLPSDVKTPVYMRNLKHERAPFRSLMENPVMFHIPRESFYFGGFCAVFFIFQIFLFF